LASDGGEARFAGLVDDRDMRQIARSAAVICEPATRECRALVPASEPENYKPSFAAALSVNKEPRRMYRRSTGKLRCPV
jgi:hypothetical protein